MPTQRFSSIEILEARIAPAAVFFNATTATYSDNDGDHVTVHFTEPILTSGMGGNLAALFTFNAAGYLALLDLTAAAAPEGTGIAFTVAKVAGGDGLANIGYINSIGHDLGAVAVKGDLGRIDAGTGSATVPAIQSLAVHSLGRLGLDTQGVIANLQSVITGALGSLVVAGDVKDAFVNVTGANGKIGAIRIGGSLVGGSSSLSGAILSGGEMGAVKIGHDVQGGSGANSGFISSNGTLGVAGGVSIGGSLLGGSDHDSGEIFSSLGMGAVKIGHDVQGGSASKSGYIESSGTLLGVSVGGSLIGGSNTDTGEIRSTLAMGAVKIGHDVQGGSGSFSGRIGSAGTLAGVSIGGSLIGGSSTFISGEIFSFGDMGAVKISHDFIGGSITGSASLDRSGVIKSSGRISSVTIGGSIISGIDASSGALTFNATIRAGNDIGSLTVKGSLIGHGDTGTGASPVVISARGQAIPLPAGATTDLAMGKISIGGRVEFANILAGYNTSLGAANGDAQIGSVKVGGDWAASNLVAGAKNLGTDDAVGGPGANADNVNYGDSHDLSIGVGNANILAKIASITIAGQVFGTPLSVNMNDHFGFVAEQIGSIKVGGNNLVLPANNTPLAIGETGDVSIHLLP